MKNLFLFLMVTFAIMSSCSTKQLEEKDARIAELESQLASLSGVESINSSNGELILDPFADQNNFVMGYPPTYAEAKLPAGIAEGRLQLYKLTRSLGSKPPTPYDPKKDIYGFTFKFEYLKKFVDEIQQINQSKPDSIDGVRVYYSRNAPNNVIKHGVFLVPTKGFKNIYDIDDDFVIKSEEIDKLLESINQTGDPDLILNASVPCPQDCN